jgi:hypothetical protein
VDHRRTVAPRLQPMKAMATGRYPTKICKILNFCRVWELCAVALCYCRLRAPFRSLDDPSAISQKRPFVKGATNGRDECIPAGSAFRRSVGRGICSA